MDDQWRQARTAARHRVTALPAKTLTPRKAIATFGTGPSRQTLEIALPTFLDYSERHGYELIIGDGDSAGRPVPWGKVPLLKRLLDVYDLVLWLDADTIILDGNVDIASVIPEDAYQAFTVCDAGERGMTPCTGVWVLRAGERTADFLSAVWDQVDLIEHPQWEQAAVARLTGWTYDWPLKKVGPTEWEPGTHLLGEEWDMLPMFPVGYAPGFIRHYGGMDYKRRNFEMRTDLAKLMMQRNGIRRLFPALRYGVGAIRRRLPQRISRLAR